MIYLGSLITLGINNFEIDWGKSSAFSSHSALFQPNDLKQIPYYYLASDSDEIILEYKEGFSRKLSSVKMRLDLLGYSLHQIRHLFDEAKKLQEDFGYQIHMSFDNYVSILQSLDITKINTPKIAIDSHDNGYDFGEFVRRCILRDPAIETQFSKFDIDQETIISRQNLFALSEFLENIDPYITLRILSDLPSNADLDLHWNFADVVDAGWVKRKEIFQGLSQMEKILIVTEGSTDSFIIKKALKCLYPDIFDFFSFIDMKEHYPFTGTGNLYNFCIGLVRIDIMNRILVIFDNDTAGVEKYEKSLSVHKPGNLVITRLPNHTDFTSFPTIGPQGKSTEDINGKAVSIECFLDLSVKDSEPAIRWTKAISRGTNLQR